MQNPLLLPYSTPFKTPPFTDIQAEHFLPAFKIAMQIGRSEINAIASNKKPPSFSNTIEALEKAGEQLKRISSILYNLNAAETNKNIQLITADVSQLISEYSNDIWLNPELFKRVQQLYNKKEELKLSREKTTLLEKTYKNFKRSGALLSDIDKERYRDITAELSKLSVQFGENLLEETNNYHLHIINKADLSGLPPAICESAKYLAEKENKEGWLFSLQGPSYLAFMKYADNRKLREKLFKAYSFRANQNNPYNNKENLIRQVDLRMEQAKLLGYKTFSHYVLEERMAGHPDKVMDLLNDLYEKAYPYALKEINELIAFAKKEGFKGKLQKWDFAYYSEKLKNSLYNVDDEMIKPYFQLENVKQGIFKLTTKLWGLSYKKNDSIPKYHKDVEVYEVYDNDGSFLSVLYLDFHPRKSKQGGAWMTSYKNRHIKNRKIIPSQISVVCNFTEGTGSQPSLLNYQELTTFLHEFGHALHGIFSKVKYESLSGTNVFRDFVELPSQLMENWAREKEWLQEVGTHYKSGEAIADELVDKIIAGSNFQSGYQTIRQLGFAYNDMAWHTVSKAIDIDPELFEKQAMSKTELLPIIDNSCFSTAFAHIFNGGYASGYYGYKWAEVLDADAYSLFEKKGIYDTKTAVRFRKLILSKGGTVHPMDLYIKFKGGEPTVEHLLKRNGLK